MDETVKSQKRKSKKMEEIFDIFCKSSYCIMLDNVLFIVKYSNKMKIYVERCAIY